LSICHQIKYWSAHKIAAFIGHSARRAQGPVLRSILIGTIFKRLVRWQKLEMRSTTAFGAIMYLSLPDSIQTCIFLTGCWEPTITKIVSTSLQAGDIFIDVGANVGYYTLLASLLVGGNGKVYAIEASPSIFSRLKKNISANNLNNVQLFNMAVSNAQGKIWIWTAPKGNLGHSTIVESVAATDGHHREAEVSCNTMGALISLADLLAARMIKIDIEGAERLAIEGVLPHLREFSERTEWLIELSPAFCPGGPKDTDWIFNIFIDAGYSAYKIENSYKPLSSAFESASANQIARITEAPQDRLNDILFSKRRERCPN